MVSQLIEKAENFSSSISEEIDKESTYLRYCIPRNTAIAPSQVRIPALSASHCILTGWDDHQSSVCPSQSRKRHNNHSLKWQSLKP